MEKFIKRKVGDKVKVISDSGSHCFKIGGDIEIIKIDTAEYNETEGNEYEARDSNGRERWIRDIDILQEIIVNTQAHYKGKDSLYKFCEEWGLNAYEFDILKRVVRCRHKGEFKKDLEKTKDLIDIYLKEYGG